jgi:transcriptional regulator with XRE-family HTH domain
MSFGENLRNVRKQRGVTQEELAEILGVSRQAISKWESDGGYPETEKLLVISKTLNISIDYLLNDVSVMEEKEKTEKKSVVYAPTGKIAITTYDNQNVVFCQSVKTSPIFRPGKDEPKYILNGIDKVTFWGEHTTLLGWYATLEDVEKEISEITKAIQNGEVAYKLKYNADVESGTLGSPKLKK